MNFIRFLTREELVGGLEISDSYLRIVLLEIIKVKKGPKAKPEDRISVKCIGEEKVKSGAIVNGIVENEEELLTSFKNLAKKCAEATYVVVSLPQDQVYSKVFSFPKTVQGERLEESMKLTVGFQLPVKPEDVYLDWENIETSDKNEIFLSAISKNIINKYAELLEKAGFKLVAIESFPTSLTRAMEGINKEAVLVKVPSESSTLISILYKRFPYFSRVLPQSLFPSDKVEEEAKKIIDFFEAERDVTVQELTPEELRITYDLYNNNTLKQNNGKWLIAVGAALRGMLPRSEDNLVSLMPVGTEEAYAMNKAAVFAGFVSKIVMITAIFFTAVFLGTWIFITYMQQVTNKQIEAFSLVPVPQGSAELEAQAINLNELAGALAPVVSNSPKWDIVLAEIRARMAPGIFVTNLSSRLPNEPVNLSGVATNRTQLNMFKRFLEGSSMFTEINMPTTNLGLKENIPFTVSFKLKDPALILNQ